MKNSVLLKTGVFKIVKKTYRVNHPGNSFSLLVAPMTERFLQPFAGHVSVRAAEVRAVPARGQEVVLPERENLLRQLGLRSKAELREGREGRGRAKDALSRRPRGSECFVINFLSRFLSVATKTGKNNYFYAHPLVLFVLGEVTRG